MLTEKQRQKLRDAGYSDLKIRAYEVKKFGGNTATEKVRPESESRGSDLSFFEEAAQDIGEIREGFGEDVERRRENVAEIGEATAAGEQTRAEGAFQNIGQVAGTAFDALNRGVMGIGKAVLPQSAEDKISDAAKPILENIAQSETVQEAQQKWQSFQEENPRAARNITAALQVGEGVAETVGLGPVTRTISAGTRGTRQAIKGIGDLFPKGKVFNSVEDVFEQAGKTIDNLPDAQKREILPTGDEAITAGRKQAEEALPKRNFKQYWVDMDPAMQKVYEEADPNKVADYLNTTIRANADLKNAPSVMEFGGDQARRQVDEIQKMLDNTGSEIGKVRQKLANIQAPIDQVNKIEETFKNQVEKLNLAVKNGKVVRTRKPSAKISNGDINALNDLYRDLLNVKSSPKLDNLVDLRQGFDSRIKFGKRVGEVSNEVDPVARNVRKDVARVMEDMVGRENAADVERYSNVVDALNELRSYTDRKAGGEYLLRSVVSGTGGEAQNVINTVKNLTGYDLKEDALIMSDLITRFANKGQKTRFRSQIEEAGFTVADDAFNAARGDVGSLMNLIQKGIDRFVDEEDVIRATAGAGN